MITQLRRALRHPVSQNLVALYSLQPAMFAVPLMTLQYVGRVLRQSAFGLVVFSPGLAFVLLVFIDWGFGFTGTRSTAENQADRTSRRASSIEYAALWPCPRHRQWRDDSRWT